MEKARIRQATKKGYIECEIGGVADFSYPTSKLRRGRVQGGGNICPTITSQSMGICKIEANPGGGVLDMQENYSSENMVVVGGLQEHQHPCTDGIFPTLKAAMGGEQTPIFAEKGDNMVAEEGQVQYRIRKLTPLECWRLMGFSDEDFHKAEMVNSNTQLYKQAGNSIVENVLVAIFGQMLPGKESVYKELGNRNYNEGKG